MPESPPPSGAAAPAPDSDPPASAPAEAVRAHDAVHVIWRIIKYALRYRRGLSATLLATVGTAGFAIATPELLEWAVDTGLGVEVEGGVTTVDVDESLLVVAGLALLGAALFRGISQFVQAYLGESIAQAVAYDIRNQIYERLQALSFAYHDDAETGQVMVRATQDVEVVRMFLNIGGIRLIFTVGLLMTVMILMFLTNSLVALVVLPFMVVLAIRSYMVSHALVPLWRDVQEGQAQLGTVLQEALTGIRVVKAFAREPVEGEKFGAKAKWLYRTSYATSMIQARHQPFMTALWMGAMIATVWVGGIEVAKGNLDAGGLTKFLFFVALIQMPVRTLGWMVMMVPRAATAGRRIFEILDRESVVLESPTAVAPTAPRGHVRFEDVSFSYDSERPVLDHVDFDAKPGEVVALLGPTGSGKSSIVNLIPRFYDVTGGAVTFDGADVRGLTMAGLRAEVAIVQQDVFLFAATLRDNIAYGRPDATDEEVEAAARLARVHDYIVTLPAGYRTWVGERGATLSGGQKQRIAIARALLMDPRVLVFDDSTSSVDTGTEQEIQRAMSALMQGRTTFIIAHRLRSVRDADQILVLDQGRIVQRGRHAELLAQGGLYREIHDLELRDQAEAYAQIAGGAE